MSRFSLTPAPFTDVSLQGANEKFSVVGYGYYSINLDKHRVDEVEKEWKHIVNLAKTFPGFIEGKLMFPTTPLYVHDPNKGVNFLANVVAYGHWKTKSDDYRWVKGALCNGWGFNKLYPEHKVHVTMLEK